ncbi:hypothetical protein D3C76_1002120 [compost metagenome]
MCRGGTLGLGTVLQRQAQGRQVGQGVGIGVEGFFGRRLFSQCLLGLRRDGLQHRRHRLGLGLDQLCTGLCISDLAGHQAGIAQAGVSLGLVVSWQFVAVIGNRGFVGRVFLAAWCRFRLVLGLGLGNLVVRPAGLVAPLPGHHLAKAVALVAQRLQRFVRLRVGRARGAGNGVGLQQRVGCDRHRAVSAPETKKTSGQRQARLAPSRVSARRDTLLLIPVEALHLDKFLIDAVDQVFDAIKRGPARALLQLLA